MDRYFQMSRRNGTTFERSVFWATLFLSALVLIAA